MKGISRRARIGAVTAAAGVAVLASSALAQAQTRPEKVGDGIPTGQMSTQMFNYGTFISQGTPASMGSMGPLPGISQACLGPAPTTPPTPNPANTPACHWERLEALFQMLTNHGVTGIELFGHASFPANTDTAGLERYRTLMDKYGLHAAGWHGSMNETTFDARIAAARILGADYLGSGGVADPGIGSYQAVLDSAAALNRMGKKSVEAGVGPVYIHNHDQEFVRQYEDNGTLKTAFDIVMERTNPRYVIAELDTFWSSDTFGDPSGVQSAALIDKWSSRIKMLHIKDGINMNGPGRQGSPRATGTGEHDFRPILTAAKNRVQWYHHEHDGGNVSDARLSFTNLKGVNGQVVPTLQANPMFISGGTVGGARVTETVWVQNVGDQPLSIQNVQIANSANPAAVNAAREGESPADFSIVGNTCTGATLGPGYIETPTQPWEPRGQCIVTVAFNPTRTNTSSTTRLVFTSNADSATEHVLVAAKSSPDAESTITGTVPATLSLALGTQAGFGPFTPGVARTYDISTSATVTSTAGDATLSVADPSTTAPGRLVNGSFALPQALQARASTGTNTTTAFAPMSGTAGTPLTLLTYDGPTAGAAPLMLHFRQVIGANDGLRTGAYGKTLTFTLSTTNP